MDSDIPPEESEQHQAAAFKSSPQKPSKIPRLVSSPAKPKPHPASKVRIVSIPLFDGSGSGIAKRLKIRLRILIQARNHNTSSIRRSSGNFLSRDPSDKCNSCSYARLRIPLQRSQAAVRTEILRQGRLTNSRRRSDAFSSWTIRFVFPGAVHSSAFLMALRVFGCAFIPRCCFRISLISRSF